MRVRALTTLLAGLAVLAAACGGTASPSGLVPSGPPTQAPAGSTAPAAPSAPNVEGTTGPPGRPASVTLPVPSLPPATVAPTTAAPTTAPLTVPATTEVAVTATVPATAAPIAAPPDGVGTGAAALATDALQVVEIGRSVEGRPILAVQRGEPGGVPVLVIGVIHGNEDAGVAIVERLATAPVPPGVSLWLVESMNPDGQAAQRRGNANLVDLNRNFPLRWGPIGQAGDGQYAGTGPASEPETQAVVAFASQVRPALTLWYHQDLYRLSPGEGVEGELKARYAELTGLPIVPITGGTYTGVAATWLRTEVSGYSFIVELGSSLPPEEAERHAAAVADLAARLAAR